jgi:hypothetical protein
MDAPQDYDKPISLLIVGSGDSTKANIKAVLDNLCFDPTGGREIHLYIPFDKHTSGYGLAKVVDWADATLDTEQGDIKIGIVAEGHKLVARMAQTIKAEQPEDPFNATSMGLFILDGFKDSTEPFVVFLYDPEKDMDELTFVKSRGVRTVNLCEGGIDSFDGYESPEEKATREKAIADFEEKLTAGKISGPTPTKAPAKKATAARKRAATKLAVPEDVPLTEELQKPVQTPSEALPTIHVETDREKAIALGYGPGDSWDEERDGMVQSYYWDLGSDIVNASGWMNSESLENRKKELLKLDAAEMVKHCTMDKLSQDELDFVRASGLYTAEDIFTEVDNAARQVLSSDTVQVKKSDLLRLLSVLTDIVEGMTE